MTSYKRPTPKPRATTMRARSTTRSAPLRATPKPKPKAPVSRDPVAAEHVVLVRGKGTKDRGGGPGGEYWRVDVDGHRAGVVFINLIDEPPLGRHASIQIFLNEKSQGRRIGRTAYRKACEASQHPVIYAHMRKSNTASRRAAEEAGFAAAETPGDAQLTMVWRRA